MDKKSRPIYMLSPRDLPQIETYIQTKSKDMEKDISCKWKGNKASKAILISDKIDFKTKAIVRDTEEHYIIIKGTIQQEDITLAYLHVPNIGAPKYVKQILVEIKGDIDRNSRSWGY